MDKPLNDIIKYKKTWSYILNIKSMKSYYWKNKKQVRRKVWFIEFHSTPRHENKLCTFKYKNKFKNYEHWRFNSHTHKYAFAQYIYIILYIDKFILVYATLPK